MRHISSLPYNAVSLLYVLVLSHHKSMVLYRGGPLCQSLHVLESHMASSQAVKRLRGMLPDRRAYKGYPILVPLPGVVNRQVMYL